MISELKTFQFTCDKCGKKETTQAIFFTRPAGWDTEESHGWGLTNYSRTLDFCPKCKRLKSKSVLVK